MDLYVVWNRNAVPIAAHQTDNSAKSSSDNISYLKEEGKKNVRIVFDISILGCHNTI